MVWGLVVPTSAFIVGVKGQQAVEAVLLLTPATNQGDYPLWAHWEWMYESETQDSIAVGVFGSMTC